MANRVIEQSNQELVVVIIQQLKFHYQKLKK